MKLNIEKLKKLNELIVIIKVRNFNGVDKFYFDEFSGFEFVFYLLKYFRVMLIMNLWIE